MLRVTSRTECYLLYNLLVPSCIFSDGLVYNLEVSGKVSATKCGKIILMRRHDVSDRFIIATPIKRSMAAHRFSMLGCGLLSGSGNDGKSYLFPAHLHITPQAIKLETSIFFSQPEREHCFLCRLPWKQLLPAQFGMPFNGSYMYCATTDAWSGTCRRWQRGTPWSFRNKNCARKHILFAKDANFPKSKIFQKLIKDSISQNKQMRDKLLTNGTSTKKPLDNRLQLCSAWMHRFPLRLTKCTVTSFLLSDYPCSYTKLSVSESQKHSKVHCLRKF